MASVRAANTKTSGAAFSPAVIRAVWAKGVAMAGYDANLYRKDKCGAWMAYREYGQTSQHGWEIDHEFPVARGGGDGLDNLQPLHWRNNRGKGDDYPHWSCTVR